MFEALKANRALKTLHICRELHVPCNRASSAVQKQQQETRANRKNKTDRTNIDPKALGEALKANTTLTNLDMRGTRQRHIDSVCFFQTTTNKLDRLQDEP